MVGDVVCTTVMCYDGRRKVAEMWHAFDYLSANHSEFDRNHFLPAANTLQQSLDAIDSWYATWIPFNPVCCSIDDIGNQALILMDQMMESVGVASVPAPPPTTNWSNVIIIGGIVLLAVVYSPQIKKAIS